MIYKKNKIYILVLCFILFCILYYITSLYEFTDKDGILTNLDNCYNGYTSGIYANDTGYEINDIDISKRYNKLGTTSFLKYPHDIPYEIDGSQSALNDRFELKMTFSPSNGTYSTTPIYNDDPSLSGVLIKITDNTTITFNVNVKNIKFVLAAGGGGGGGTGGGDSTGQSDNGGGGGGAGGWPNSPVNGTVNTGSGGGGGLNTESASAPRQNGANGGSGVCYIVITNDMLS